jgi:hypothetical protein
MKNRIIPPYHILGAIAVILACTHRTEGSVMQVTGAGAGDGLSINPSSVVDAIYGGFVDNSTTTNTYMVQGVTFQTEYTDFSYFNGFPLVNSYNGTKSTLGNVLIDSPGGDTIANSFTDQNNSDDPSLISIMNGGGFYNSSTPLSATIMGLTPNASYVVNFLMSSGGFPTRSESLLLNGTLADTITMTQGAGTSDIIYATANTAKANASGQITVQFNENSGGYPLFNAVIVSTPEPTPYCLLGGIVWMLSTRRCRRHNYYSSFPISSTRGGLAHDQRAGDLHVAGRPLGMGDAVVHQLQCRLGDLGDGLADGGQRRGQQRRDGPIVKPDDLKITGHGNSQCRELVDQQRGKFIRFADDPLGPMGDDFRDERCFDIIG